MKWLILFSNQGSLSLIQNLEILIFFAECDHCILIWRCPNVKFFFKFLKATAFWPCITENAIIWMTKPCLILERVIEKRWFRKHQVCGCWCKMNQTEKQAHPAAIHHGSNLLTYRLWPMFYQNCWKINRLEIKVSGCFGSFLLQSIWRQKPCDWGLNLCEPNVFLELDLCQS